MSGIFGLIHLDGSPVPREHLQAMRDAMAHWGPDGVHVWHEGAAGLGQCLVFDTPEAAHEYVPYASADGRLAFTAEARIDNRDELCDFFDISSSDRSATPDTDLILLAYARWGDQSPEHLLGDWSFAVWHPRERRLFLARDHHGNTSLYFFNDGRRIAFASDRKAILAVDGVGRRINDVYVAQLLVAWSAYYGDETIHDRLYRLAPAHAMVSSLHAERRWRYWFPEQVSEVRLATAAEYAEGLRHHFQEAVRARVRTNRPVVSTLSGGLDSGALTVLAAREFATHGRRILALTSVPLFRSKIRGAIGDEFSLAAATVRMAPNIDHRTVDAHDVSPLDGLERSLKIHMEPGHAVINYYWLLALLDQARDSVVLSGQTGNASFSWGGVPDWWDVSRAVWDGAFLAAARSVVRLARTSSATVKYRSCLRSLRPSDSAPWRRYSAIHPDLAARVNLRDRMVTAGHDPTFRARSRDRRGAQLRMLLPGRNILGALWAELGAACGVVVRDPCHDIRLVSFTLGVPNRYWRGPLDRWLARDAMKGVLPDSVRMARTRGRQAADVPHRLRQESSRLVHLIQEVEASDTARHYVDVPYMRAVASRAMENPGAASHLIMGSVLQRDLAVGLFVARFV